MLFGQVAHSVAVSERVKRIREVFVTVAFAAATLQALEGSGLTIGDVLDTFAAVADVCRVCVCRGDAVD